MINLLCRVEEEEALAEEPMKFNSYMTLYNVIVLRPVLLYTF